MSDQDDRGQRRDERLEAETKATEAARRQRLLQLSVGGVFLAIIIVVVIIIVAGSGGGDKGGESSNLSDIGEVNKLLTGIPQNATVLGKPGAPVKMFEYGDLQCPFCKEYSETYVQELIEGPVKKGELKIDYRDYIIIGEQSIPAGEAAAAAGAQGKGWNFIELFYRNQGEENSGYVTDEFLTSIAKGAGVKDIGKWNKERGGKEFTSEVEATTEQAQNFGFTGTPSFAIEGPSSNGIELLQPQSSGEIEEAIEKAS
jgi:protein-disulfide isomerase